MAGILMTIFRVGIDALTFVRTNCTFSKSGCGDTEVEYKRHDLAEKKRERVKDKWNEDRIKRLDVINQRMFQTS